MVWRGFQNYINVFLKTKYVGIGELKGVLLEAFEKKKLSPP